MLTGEVVGISGIVGDEGLRGGGKVNTNGRQRDDHR